MTYASMLRAIVALAAIPALTGCTALSAIGDATTPLEVYELRAPTDIPTAKGRTLPREVIVELPTTSGALETDRIMIRPNSLQAQYLPDVRWSEPAPVMVQTLMLRSIEATEGVRYVARQPLAANGDFIVVTELTDFQAELGDDEKTAIVRIRLIARIVREDDASIVASRTFVSAAQSSALDTQELVKAFDTAAGSLLSDFAAWVLSVLRAQ